MQAGTPLGQTMLLEIDNHLLKIGQPAPNKINICFDEISENLRHEITNYQLQKVNFKTVISSLKKLHPNILKAKLQKNCDELFVMTISVSYQFLPQITEEIIFSKRQIMPEESEGIAIENMKNYLNNTKEQIKALTNTQVLSGAIEPIGNEFEVYFPIPHPKMLITWSLKLNKPPTLLKAQMYYFNSITKQKSSTELIPNEGVFLYYTGNECTTQLRFIAEQSDKYDNVMLQIQDKCTGSYIISIQKVEIV